MKRLFLLLLPIALILLQACSEDIQSHEEMVRDRIEEGRQFATERKTDKLVAMVTDDFLATRGIDKKNLKIWMARFYLSSKSAKVFVRIKEVRADWQTAEATILMGTTNLSLKEMNLDKLRGRLLHMTINFRFIDEVWMINQVDWRDARPEDLTIF